MDDNKDKKSVGDFEDQFSDDDDGFIPMTNSLPMRIMKYPMTGY